MFVKKGDFWEIIFKCIAFMAITVTLFLSSTAFSAEKDYYRIVVLSDVHFPGKNVAVKESALTDTNSWDDVDEVIVLGDVCYELGTDKEYAGAKEFFSQLQRPTHFIVGNHDYIYKDQKVNGKKVKGTPEERKAKLDLFKATFGMDRLYYSQKVGGYLLVYLSVDDLYSRYLCQMSDEELNWLDEELSSNRNMPTIIFFHAPLAGTFVNNSADNPSFVAQPSETIRQLILQNPQVFMWVAGHIHLAATNANFNSDLNLYEHQVMNIHMSAMKGTGYLSDQDSAGGVYPTLWTNSLYLYPDKVIVQTYDHKEGIAIKELERTIAIPQLN